jgi:hypothetical protein
MTSSLNEDSSKFNLNDFKKTIEDVNHCICKSYLRKGTTELKLKKTERESDSYKKGLDVDL